MGLRTLKQAAYQGPVYMLLKTLTSKMLAGIAALFHSSNRLVTLCTFSEKSRGGMFDNENRAMLYSATVPGLSGIALANGGR